jgi:hypothetical protein
MHARLQAQPWCIYCGGVNEAMTTDHMPPITIFEQRRRPHGLEFSACEPCNSGGRVAEKVVGLVSRMYPDPANDAGREELKRLYREFARHHPDLLQEMWPTHDQLQQEVNLPAGMHVLNARGPGAHTPNRKQSLFVARFREAFAVAGMVYDDFEPPEVEGFSVVRPGFLRSNS